VLNFCIIQVSNEAQEEREGNSMEKKYRLITETGRVLLGGETYSHNAAERWFDDFNGIYEDEETESEERIYIEEV
jgi:hypothetical protein